MALNELTRAHVDCLSPGDRRVLLAYLLREEMTAAETGFSDFHFGPTEIAAMLCDVGRFRNEVINQAVPDRPVELSEDRAAWFRGVLVEEINEYIKARVEHDLPGQVDAIVDLIYFAIGRLWEMGVVPTAHVWSQVHDSNMTKTAGDKGRGSADDAVKPEGFRPPDLAWLSEWSPAFRRAAEIRAKKGADYNRGPVKRDDYYPFGAPSYVHDIYRKVLRLRSLVGTDGAPVVSETLVDTVLDLINQACFFYEWLTRETGAPE